MEELFKEVDKQRNIKKVTLDNYKRNLKTMYKGVEGDKEFNVNFLNNFNKVKKYLETLLPSVKKTRIAVILVILRLNEKKNKKLINKYTEYLGEVKKKYDAMINENKKNAKQSDNWVAYKKLVKVFNNYVREVKEERLNKVGKKVLTNKEKDLLNKYLVAGLYILHPAIRLDYAGMKIISDKAYNKLSEDDLDNNNYLVIQGRNNKKFHFGKNTYKTGKKYGHKIKPVEKKLNQVLNVWLKHNGDKEYLLNGIRGKPLTRNGLTKFIMKVFTPSGSKKISSNMIRHILISENEDMQKLQELKKKAEKLADDMHHSTEQQQSTYYKDK